jgi:hypothetical protein
MKETVENRIDIFLPEDIQKITSKPRQSIYFLSSLETFFRTHVVTEKHYNKELFEERVKRIEGCQNKFEELENKLYYPKETQLLPNGTYKVEIDLIEFVEIAVEYLKLQEEIDELQLEILKYLFDVENDIISKIISKDKYLEPLVMQHSGKAYTYSAFEHSVDEDKLDNYRIHISDKKESKKYSKKNIYPIPVKVRNNDFLLNKYRTLYKIIKNSQIQLLTDGSRLREEEEIRKMSIEQFNTSKKINQLTFVTTIIAIVGFIYASISTYQLLTDNSTDIEFINDQNEQKLLLEIKNELKRNSTNEAKTDSLLIELTKSLKNKDK